MCAGTHTGQGAALGRAHAGLAQLGEAVAADDARDVPTGSLRYLAELRAVAGIPSPPQSPG